MASLSRNEILKWVLLLTLVMIWGSSFLLMKKALRDFSPGEIGALRMVFASGVLLPFALKGFREITGRQWIYLTIFAFVGNAFPAFLFAQAQTRISSSLAGILNALTPMFTLVIALFFYRFKVYWWQITGLVMGLAGSVAIIYSSGEKDFSANMISASLILLATLFYALNINILKYKLADLESAKITIYGFSLLFLPLTLYLFLGTPFIHTVSQAPGLSIFIYPAVLGLVCSAGAIFIFNALIKISSVIFASSVTYLIPVTALFLGVSDGEAFNPWMLVWIIIVLAGVLLVNRKK